MGGLFSKSQQQSSAAASSEKTQNEQKSEVAEHSLQQQTVDVHEQDTKQHGKEEEAKPAADKTTVASPPPPAEPQQKPDDKEPEVVETTQVVEELQPSEQLMAEPAQSDASVSEAVEVTSSEQAPATPVRACDDVVEPETEQAGGEETSPAPEMSHVDVDTLVDDVTKLKIVPNEVPAETGNEQEVASSDATESRQETDSAINVDQFIEQTTVGPVDNACEQRVIENEAA